MLNVGKPGASGTLSPAGSILHAANNSVIAQTKLDIIIFFPFIIISSRLFYVDLHGGLVAILGYTMM
jgi:hypothetical protein